ncbi:hypothetical protein HanRHA438_Chr16g0766021 [Helianthus annuus]|nr:hypothetical protein HanRHA438_Chr16g0766021 [Helianthus annuus]
MFHSSPPPLQKSKISRFQHLRAVGDDPLVRRRRCVQSQSWPTAKHAVYGHFWLRRFTPAVGDGAPKFNSPFFAFLAPG